MAVTDLTTPIGAGPLRMTDALARLIAERTCPSSILQDVVRLSMIHFIDGISFRAPLPHGPRLYISNHQTGFDLLFLSVPLAGLTGERLDVLTWSGLTEMHHGEMLVPLIDRDDGRQPKLSDAVQVARHDTLDPSAVVAARDAFAAGLTSKDAPRSLVVAAEGMLERYDSQRIERVSSAMLDLALAAEVPIVPVRFAWGLPDDDQGRRYLWPDQLAPMHVFVGDAILPDHLVSLALRERSALVADAINGLVAPAPAAHRSRNATMHQRVAALIQQTGITQTKAILIDLILASDRAGLTEEGVLVRDFILTGAASTLAGRTDWLYDWALLLTDGMLTNDLALQDLYGADHRL